MNSSSSTPHDNLPIETPLERAMRDGGDERPFLADVLASLSPRPVSPSLARRIEEAGYAPNPTVVPYVDSIFARRGREISSEA